MVSSGLSLHLKIVKMSCQKIQKLFWGESTFEVASWGSWDLFGPWNLEEEIRRGWVNLRVAKRASPARFGPPHPWPIKIGMARASPPLENGLDTTTRPTSKPTTFFLTFFLKFVYIYVCVCVYIYIYIYISVCVCVCVLTGWRVGNSNLAHPFLGGLAGQLNGLGPLWHT